MDRYKLTHEILASCKGMVQRAEHCFEKSIGFDQGEFYFNYYTVDEFWGVAYFGRNGIPPYREVTLPTRLAYADQLADFWLIMTGEELEPLN